MRAGSEGRCGRMDELANMPGLGTRISHCAIRVERLGHHLQYFPNGVDGRRVAVILASNSTHDTTPHSPSSDLTSDLLT